MELRRRSQLGNSPRVQLPLLLATLLVISPYAVQAQLMIIGNDEKITPDDAGKAVLLAPGEDMVSRP